MFTELNGKRLLVLGGSAWISIIKAFAIENNITLIGAGNKATSPLVELDEFYEIDSTDNDAMKSFILKKHINGVYLGSNETVIRHAIQYVHELGLPCYCTTQQWDILMNKRKFKELCGKFDLPVTKSFNYELGQECKIDFPVIVKPEDGCGSQGITICNNKNELNIAIGFAKNNSPSEKVIIEELVNNSGMDVFFQISNGDIEWCALGDKYPVQFEDGAGSVAGARVLPSLYTSEFRKRFENKIKNLFKSVGLYQGLIWMEVFHDGDNYYFNEVGYRPNGSLSIVGIDYLCDINTVAADIYYSLTGKGKAHVFSSLILKEVAKGKKKVCEYWVASNPGVIGKIEGIEELNRYENVLAVFPKYAIGDVIPHTNGFAQNFCVIHFAYDSASEMNNIISFIRKTIKLYDNAGKDMIIHKSKAFIENVLKDNN